MGILAWIVLGGIAGFIASMIMRNNEGFLANIVVGIVGALLGGWVVQAFGGSGVNGFNWYSLLVAILGSVILLGIVNFFRRGSAQV